MRRAAGRKLIPPAAHSLHRLPMTSPEQIQTWLAAGLPGAQVQVTGDGHHFEAVIVHAEFADKSLVQRHQMVYRALGDKMKAEIHALSMKTLTPAEQK